ncbi:hypothetical protein OAV04_00920, partial [Candidatus Poseidoniaceae archaeon]|nr:hypothetical protein [Candidatus Poseidoniaceae archaeon]
MDVPSGIFTGHSVLLTVAPNEANPFEWALLPYDEAEGWNHRTTQHPHCRTALLAETYTLG